MMVGAIEDAVVPFCRSTFWAAIAVCSAVILESEGDTHVVLNPKVYRMGVAFLIEAFRRLLHQ